MRAVMTVCLILALCSGSLAQDRDAIAGSELLLSREVVLLPPFEALADHPLIHLYANEEEYRAAHNDRKYLMERLVYASDGLQVVAYLYRQRDIIVASPAIVFNRGGFVRQNTAPELLVTFHRLAKAGYVIIAPMYRGSENSDGRDEMGGDDLNDLMRIATLADELASVDVDRLFLLGESRGGMMVLQAIRDGFPALAAATFGAPTNFYALLDQQPDQYQPMADQLWPGWREQPDEVLGRRSAVRWVKAIDVPLLIMHGGNDQSMPVDQSLALAHELQKLQKNYELHIFGYENHVISGKAPVRDTIAADWFGRHMK